jgi:RecA/RadA recombinase
MEMIKMATASKKQKQNPFALKYLKALGENASIVSEGTIYDNREFVNTGCLLLNAQISKSIYNGIPTHKIITLAGEESTGKTFVLLGILKNFLEQTENGMVVFFESEGAVNKETFEERGLDTSRIILKSVKTVEEFRHISTTFVKNYTLDKPEERPKILMCLDSLGMLPSAKEVKDAEEGNDKSDMTRPKIIKSLFRILTVELAVANIPFIVTNHVYATMDMYGKPEMGGGSGLKYAGSTILFFGKSQFKEKDEETKKEEHAGITVTSTTIKGRDTRINKKVKFVIHADYGLDKFSGLFDFCKEHGMIDKTGNRWYWKSEGIETAIFKKQIDSKPSEFFTKNRLDEIDTFCQSYFGYGKGDLESMKSNISDDEDEPELEIPTTEES